MTMTTDTNPTPGRQKLIRLLQDAAAKAVAQEDPWAQYNMSQIPAERVIRHLYQPESKTWIQDETIVKIQPEAFTHGAMRFCYRLKKRATLPQSASNHRFHNYSWNQASNYVAKAYHVDGEIDTSEGAKEAVRNDIALQYEASYWAKRFNEKKPPKSIVFLRAYAMEFPNRPGKPWFAVERFISGHDVFGAGFTKHNTNAGFVDEDLHRITPQVFSAFSFYDSEGERLVADIQGVGDLYTDPQVLSADYRFGDGDLGPRGMALFFKTFRHNSLAASMGIPVFPLSKNELKHQAKYEDDEGFSHNDDSSYLSAIKGLDRFAALDINRKYRQSVLLIPPQEIIPDDLRNTERRSNQSKIREDIRKSLRISSTTTISKRVFSRSASDVDEVTTCLELAKEDFKFDNKLFCRKESGEMKLSLKNTKRSSLFVRQVSDPMPISKTTIANLGKVHYQLAVLHGMGRFPEVVPVGPDDDPHTVPNHDAFSVLYHLAHAASMNCVAALLALGRLRAGLGTSVSNLLQTIVPIDFDSAKELLRRAMDSPFGPAGPRAAAGCLLYQVYLDERESDNLEEEKVSDTTIMHLIDDILKLMDQSGHERAELDEHKKRTSMRGGGRGLQPGDRVEGNYCLEGSYYPGQIESVSEDGNSVVIRYDDDGSTETLTSEHVRLIVPPAATQTALGGPLSDEDAFGGSNSDEKFLVEIYDLKAELGELKAIAGDKEAAAALLEEASNEAMSAGKMQKATEWSLKASELLE